MNTTNLIAKSIITIGLCSSVALATNNTLTVQQSSATQTLLSTYQSNGLTFDAARGKALWQQTFANKTGERACNSCHTNILTETGKHATTGKLIEAMSPYANPKRLSETRQIEKWFTRNCKWTIGRLCSEQEKGDFLYFLTQQEGQ